MSQTKQARGDSARNQSCIGDRMEKKPWEKVLLWPDETSSSIPTAAKYSFCLFWRLTEYLCLKRLLQHQSGFSSSDTGSHVKLAQETLSDCSGLLTQYVRKHVANTDYNESQLNSAHSNTGLSDLKLHLICHALSYQSFALIKIVKLYNKKCCVLFWIFLHCLLFFEDFFHPQISGTFLFYFILFYFILFYFILFCCFIINHMKRDTWFEEMQ